MIALTNSLFTNFDRGALEFMKYLIRKIIASAGTFGDIGSGGFKMAVEMWNRKKKRACFSKVVCLTIVFQLALVDAAYAQEAQAMLCLDISRKIGNRWDNLIGNGYTKEYFGSTWDGCRIGVGAFSSRAEDRADLISACFFAICAANSGKNCWDLSQSIFHLEKTIEKKWKWDCP
jgi:hypothetical protein